MDENTIQSLNQLLMALKSMSKSVEKSFYHGAFQGVGDMVVKNYRSLHARAVELLPDDFYIHDVLALEEMPEGKDKEKLGQVNLLVSQLTDYLENLLKTEQRMNFQMEVEDWKGLGRDLTEQIIENTRRTLRRALSNIDVGMAPPPPPSSPPPPGSPPPGAPPWAAPPEAPPTPPVPPVPPTPRSGDDSETV